MLEKPGWTHTISFKNFATCAYAQGPVNAAVDIYNEPAFNADDIKSVEVEVPMMTMIMEKFSMPHLAAGLTVVNTNFSSKRSVAAALLYGELTGDFFREGHFESQVNSIQGLSEKVELIHNWKMTIDLIKGIDEGLAGAGKPGVLGMAGAGNTLKEFKKHFGSQPLLSWSDIPKLLSESRADRNYFFRRYWTGIRAGLPFYSQSSKDKFRSHEQDLSRLLFKLAGRITVHLKGGQKISKECIIPPGFAGDQHRKKVVDQKFFRETAPLLGEDRAKKIHQGMRNFENQKVKDFLSIFREL